MSINYGLVALIRPDRNVPKTIFDRDVVKLDSWPMATLDRKVFKLV